MTVIGPDPTRNGTDVVRAVLVAAVTVASVTFTFVRSYPVLVSKFVPVTFTVVPGTPIEGAKLVMVGTFAAATMNAVALVADPAGAVTEMVPVVALAGTVTTSCVAVAVDTLVDTPLKATVF